MKKETEVKLEQLVKLFKKNTDQQKAVEMKKYMKDLFDFYGIPKPKRVELSKPFIKEFSQLDVKEVISVCKRLWIMPQRELQYVAMEILQKSKVHTIENSHTFFEWLIITRSWWDTVDLIASHLIGKYLLSFPEMKDKLVDSWCKSENLWLIRTAILFQLNYKDKTDEALLFGLCKQFSGEKEFFIKKAIGWALRQYARTRPEAVRKFVKYNTLQPLSIREAMKHLE